jgi:hypothetical protein
VPLDAASGGREAERDNVCRERDTEMKTIGWIGAASIVLVACATSPVPADRLAKSTAAVRSAHEVGADRVPPAALHLKVANEELDLAKKLLAEGDNHRAEYVLLRAQVDADTALQLAREEQARIDAQKTIDEVQRVKTTSPEGS